MDNQLLSRSPCSSSHPFPPPASLLLECTEKMKVMVKRLCQIHPQILSSVCLRQSSCLIYPKISPTSSQPSAPDLQSQSVLAALLLMKTITDVLKAPCCHNDCTSNSLNNKLRCSVDYLTASTIHHISVIANKVNLCYSTTQGCTIRHRSSPILLLQKSPNTFTSPAFWLT